MGLVGGVAVLPRFGGTASPLHLVDFQSQVTFVLSGLRALAGLLGGASGLIARAMIIRCSR